MMTFKTARAAQMAVTRAEKAYEAANAAYHDRTMWDGERFVPRSDFDFDAARKALDEAWEKGAKTYAAARADGYEPKCWHWGHNPTRDLVTANID